MIAIANSDSTIWHKDTVIIEIAHAMSLQKSEIHLSTNNEGPCAESLGLYSLLDMLCQRFDYDPKKVYLHTWNLVEKHSQYNIVVHAQMMYLNSARGYAKTVAYEKNFGESFRTFGHFVGHGNLPRLSLGSYLHTNHSNQTWQTYHCDIKQDYHGPFIAIEALMKSTASWPDIDQAIDLVKQAPLTLDKIDTYPILNPATLNITKVYPDFFVEIVNLTYFSGNTFYIDEKIWRPMIMRTPFIIQGPQWVIQRLQKLGFRTFSKYWDEGYTEDPADCQVTGIIDNIKMLSTKTTQELKSMYQHMQEDLEHNFELLNTIKEKDFLTCLD
jgi:hypothetical protein